MEKIVEQVWDYTKHAKYYSYRPNYAPKTIDMLVELTKSCGKKVADIGAGTGNLSIMLLERGCEVVSVEPNDAMREIGIERTKGQKIEWVRATGIDSTLLGGAFNWVTFGSSFNVMDRAEALKESYRLLQKDCYFSCMWNHRDLKDPIQEEAEGIILEFVPNYTRGVRREEQRSIIEAHKEMFDNIIYIEEDFYFHQSIENYINAWRSVKNPYWDLETKEGQELFLKIANKMQEKLPKEFDIKYTTRCWSAKKV
ncbi:class I SAM-dependent methyltransferase [Helicobacter burdigaliensis]|uniref:class I SAM-dependent methyltransferase n=1 Tax=Helicobacter burdigaliensis TaxID=2315334 RepID=UPI000EF69E97|nr:class I SAM-dependent methyltransferase [Helicobacter burdigaliensis]